MNKDNELKDLIDKGWEDMSSLLDTAMPVKKAKAFKRVYLLLLLLFVFSGIGYFAFDSFESKDKLKTKDVDSVKKDKLKNANSFVQLDSEKNIENTSIGEYKENLIQANSTGVPNYHEIGNVKEVISKSTQNIIKNNNKIVSDNHLKQGKIADGNAKAENNSIGDYLVMNEIIEKNRVKAHVEKEQTKEVTKLSVIGFKELKSKTDLKLPINFTFEKLENVTCSNCAVDLNINLVSEDVKSIGGMAGDITYRYAINRRIGVSSGIGISYFRKQGMTNSFLTAFNIKSEFDPRRLDNSHGISNRDIFAYNSAFRSPYILSRFINELYYVDLPVSMYFKMKKFSISLGIKLSYLFTGTNFTSNKNFYAGRNIVIYSDKAFFNSNIYNKFNYSTVISFDYNITNKIILTSGFNYSSIGIIKNPEDQLNVDGEIKQRSKYKDRYDKNVYLFMGMKYRINLKCKTDK